MDFIHLWRDDRALFKILRSIIPISVHGLLAKGHRLKDSKSAPVFQWCCSTPQGSPGVGRNTFLSSPHLCFIIVFICDLFVSRDDPLMS